MVTCYAPDGTPHEKEPIDAKECCEHCGYSLAPPFAVEITGYGTGEALPEVQHPVSAAPKWPRKPKGAK